ncbi:hypothetical protein BT63DRAFT_423707 [Microthyrium microscopicum]|uniref:Xylanolytic transcriptional activator regulatory domain-containing protein n=1 Tax=Microthyrium microscopicum TaxID=703497 RepID=A0A6A6UGV5_9PEZI|nr:hypothetical protein BT63DRAFT_423707 [Microthyrium microscopicum]
MPIDEDLKKLDNAASLDPYENSTIAGGLPEAARRKNERVCQILKNALPPQEKVLEVLNHRSKGWKRLTSLMVGTGNPEELTSIHSFAAKAMGPLGTPMEMAKILQMVAGESSDDGEIQKILHLIDRVVLHDDEYMGTLSGVESALSQCRMYSDIGQARRAWLTARRALNFAQLMGLHRTRVNLRQDLVFWGLFQHDRFSSLLLGTPYGVPDIHCNLTFKGKDIPLLMSHQGFLTRLAMFAGRVIDLTHGLHESSFSALIAIDNDLTRFGNQMPPEFWTVEREAPEDYMAWLQKILGQILYHQTRLILHIPYMLKSVTNNGFEYSRDTCFESARSMIAVYLVMRDPCNRHVYKAKFLDFVNFMALVTLIIGLVSANQTPNSPTSANNPLADKKRQAEDWDTVDTCIEVYQRISDQPFGKVARQSYRALQQLTKFRNGPVEGEESGVKVVVPFFGTITLKFKSQDQQEDSNFPGKTPVSMANNSATGDMGLSSPLSPAGSASTLRQPMISSMPGMLSVSPSSPYPSNNSRAIYGTSSGSHDMSTPPRSSVPSSMHPASVSATFEPSIAYDGVYMQPSPYNTEAYVKNGEAGLSQHIPSAHLPPSYGWQNVGTFDIDQDWNWDSTAPVPQPDDDLL